MTTSTEAHTRYTIAADCPESDVRLLTSTTRTPINISRTPSISHSINKIRLLSAEIGPKPSTMERVGITMCAIPQRMTMAAPV